MRVLITGAGLIGCYTAKQLIERGDEVTFFDLQPNREGGVRSIIESFRCLL